MWVKTREGLFNTDKLSKIFQVGNETFAMICGHNTEIMICRKPVLDLINQAMQNGDDVVEVDE